MAKSILPTIIVGFLLSLFLATPGTAAVGDMCGGGPGVEPYCAPDCNNNCTPNCVARERSIGVAKAYAEAAQEATAGCRDSQLGCKVTDPFNRSADPPAIRTLTCCPIGPTGPVCCGGFASVSVRGECSPCGALNKPCCLTGRKCGFGLTCSNGTCQFRAGGLIGDPHVQTLDGLLYDFQAAGDFVLATDKSSFVLQTRLMKWGERLSVTAAVATVVGGARVAFYAREVIPVRVNGAPLPVPCVSAAGSSSTACTGAVDLPNGGRIAVTGSTAQVAGTKYSLFWPEGRRLDVTIRGERAFCDALLWPGLEDRHFVGLLGDRDGDPANDLRTSDGRVLAHPPSMDQLYQDFGEGFRVRPAESLFDDIPASASRSTATATRRDADRDSPRRAYLARDLAPPRHRWAEAACRRAGIADPILLEACTLDVAVLTERDLPVPGRRPIRPMQAQEIAEAYAGLSAPLATTQAIGVRGDSTGVRTR